MSANEQPQRVHIERLELDMRNVAPATARAIAGALGPALAEALARRHLRMTSAERLDAGTLRVTSTSPTQVASDIAAAIAQCLVEKEG